MLILDFYVDEPSCFGVPPYLSPYVRYVAGALVSAGLSSEKISYMTVDQWRAAGKELPDDPEIVFLITGTTAPGKYLGGKIGTVQEILEFLEYRQHRQKGSITLLGGPIRYADHTILKKIQERNGVLIRGDVELYGEILAIQTGDRKKLAEEWIEKPETTNLKRSYEQVDHWALNGAFIVNLHPNYPHLMMEMETYRGCTRDVFCSFCTEALYGKPRFRNIDSIIAETGELHQMGMRHFRLGRQADLLTYLPDTTNTRNGFPAPAPENLLKLYSGIHKVAPEIKTLHLDNINPGTIVAHPELSRSALSIIADHNTPGDTAAMGLESVDDGVIRANHLKVDRMGAMKAIEIVNEAGGFREKGLPKILPGLNFIHGLSGETTDTFKQNYEFLSEVKERGLLLRRTNIRQVVKYETTPIAKESESDHRINKKQSTRLHNRFLYYRELIRKEIDHPMLLSVFPPGVIIEDIFIETENAGYYYGRPMGSYPVTIKFPREDPGMQTPVVKGEPLKGIIVAAEERSLVALTHPIQINLLNESTLRHLPGTGKKRATTIIMRRPLASFGDLAAIMEDSVFGNPADYLF